MIQELAEYEREPDAVKATVEMLRESLFADQPQVFAHIADANGTPVGFALWFVTYSTWTGRHGMWLEDLYVRPQQRGSGLGKALLAHLAAICVERDYRRLEWWVLDWNTPAIGFYDALGSHSMDEWTVRRLDGEGLRNVAAFADLG
jgi:GNAT superfamily N-acetyltransferase